MFDMAQHLKDRHLQLQRYHMMYSEEAATFFLWNLSGQLVGYQRYRPFAPKTKNNDPEEGRYYTRTTRTEGHPGNRKTDALGCWGMETFNYHPHLLFLTEGVFDACRLHNLGFPALAMLANDPKPFNGWLRTLTNRFVVAVCDNDDAGRKLAKLGHKAFYTDKKDLGDMTDDEVQTFTTTMLKDL